MKNRIAVVLLVVAPLLMFCANRASAQESPEGLRKVANKVMPTFPAIARNMHIQGNVRAEVVVGPNGKVKSVAVKGGHPLLAQAAQAAIWQWTWEPAPHETHESVELRFNPELK